MGIGIWHKFALTGGGATALDGIATASLADNDVCHVYAAGKYYYMVFDADATDAENSPSVIRPDDYSGSGVWKIGGSPYGDVQVQPEIVSGLPITGGVTGGTITKTGANQLTITPTTCLDSGLTAKLYTSANSTLAIPAVANTIYHIFLVKLVADESFEFRAYTTEAGVASDVQVSKYRWRGFWRTNASAQCVVGLMVGDLLLFGKSSENVVSAGVTTAYATVDHSAFIPTSRIAEIQYGARDASVGRAEILASVDGTNFAFLAGMTAASTSDTTSSAWSRNLAESIFAVMHPFSEGMFFKSSAKTLDLLINQVRCFV